MKQSISFILPLILIILIFYFFIILPQKQQQRKHTELINSLKKGDKILTSGGIYGTVVEIHKDTIIIFSGKTTLEISKAAIIKKLSK